MAFKIVGTVENNVKQFSVEFPDLFLNKNDNNTSDIRATPTNALESTEVIEKLNSNTNSIQQVLSLQTQMFTKLNKILQQQSEIQQSVQKLATTVDNIHASFNSLRTTVISMNMIKSNIDSPNFELYKFNQITSVEEFDTFEANLKDDTFKSQMFQRLMLMCGDTKKSGSGLNVAYTLIDVFFTRELMTEFSWSGGSRDEKGKHTLKSYKNFIIFYYSLIHKIDEEFHLKDLEMFLKRICRNSNRRCRALRTRRSSLRRRQKRLGGNTAAGGTVAKRSVDNGVSHSESESTFVAKEEVTEGEDSLDI